MSLHVDTRISNQVFCPKRIFPHIFHTGPVWARHHIKKTENTQINQEENKKSTLLRVIPTMTCWVEVVRWGLSSSSRSEAVWEWIQDSMWCQFVEELRFVSASRPPPRDIFSDILPDISSDILSDISFDISSDILSDIFLTYLLTFFLTYLLTFFLTYLLTCFLTFLLTFFLTYQNQNRTSTASQKKQLCKLYIYLTPRSKSNIHDNFVPVMSSPSVHQTAPPKGS